jgi:alpha-N-arabinofuranosidase
MPQFASLVRFSLAHDPSTATLRVFAGERAQHPISRYITGKFCEHLGANINQGMLAQVLENCTFADYPFFNRQMSPDGRTLLHTDPEAIAGAIRQQAARTGWPDGAWESVAEAYRDGLACWWIREGRSEAAQASPDTGPFGGRAQRVQVRDAGAGIAQWSYLPLHRVRMFEVTIVARALGLSEVSVGLYREGSQRLVAATTLSGLTEDWCKVSARLDVPDGEPDDVPYRITITADHPGQFIIERALLLPADHVNGFDPEVIRLLKESKLPILRWPGGNFVSGYNWRDGVGPRDGRPTRPNPAWGGVEPNLFGTDEFMDFCRAVGCEPMICVNAGDGTPEAAAAWVEYCNGPADSPMGSLRAERGRPEPYEIRHWEVGNELWGRWQVHWTTSEGYVDRYRRFARAMHAVDPTITLYACGAPVLWGKDWNETLASGLAEELNITTDHPLIGGPTPADTDPMDVYRDFMGVPAVLEKRWSDLRRMMLRSGASQPELAITELQLFAHIAPAEGSSPAQLPEKLTTPATLCEALYDVLIYHAAVRLAPFIKVITQSATVNHGGGLRKERERVYANPCHLAQSAFAAFAGAVPVAMELSADTQRMPVALGDIKNAGEGGDYPVIDAMAACPWLGDA